MQETWTTRDLPVLEAIVMIHERTGHVVRSRDIVAEVNLDADSVQAALRALGSEDPPFVLNMQGTSREIVVAGKPTGHARRAVGAWPTAEALADRLVNALDEAAEREQDDERKGLLKKTAAFLSDAGRDLAIEIGATVIRGQIGM